MKKILAGIIFPILVISLMVLPSCIQNAAKKQKEKAEKEAVDTIKSQIEENIYPLPTSADVIKMLTELEVGYIIGISNPVANTKKYFSSAKRAINMGVYGADLSYATLYNMNQIVFDYLEAIRAISEDLNMSRLYDRSLYDTIRKNFNEKDDLVRILTATFNDTYAFLAENDEQNLALLVVGGAWVEGMYLTTHVSEAAYQVAGISRVLLEQKKSFETFLEITKPYANDPLVSDFVKKLDPIKAAYAGLGTSLTEQNIKDITVAITGVRDQIIQ